MPWQADLSDTLAELHPVNGFRLGTASAGIKTPGHPDLVVMELAAASTTAAVFTQNAFCAAPVIVARDHLQQTRPAWLLINTGNANAGTGQSGIADAQACCDALATLVGCQSQAVLPFSTGVIGESLPTDRLVSGIPLAVAQLDEQGWAAAASGILTTDTVPKGASHTLMIDGRPVTLTGIAKGAGMIRPDMATMLCFIATDAAIDQALLHDCLVAAVDKSFNRITVDGDTSTNDACVLVATGNSEVPAITRDSQEYAAFSAAVSALCVQLAQSIVRDGEGATRFVTVAVDGGANSEECLQVAYTIAHSPLVKTAIFAADPNWGRVLAAVGRAGVTALDLENIQIYLDEVCIVSGGGRDPGYTEEAGQRVMDQPEMTIRVVLNRGHSSEQVWTCDLSYDYVKINAEYRT